MPLLVLLSAVLVAAMAVSSALIPIFTEADLKKVSDCLHCNYALVSNVTLAGSWTPIGTIAAPFKGRFHGQGNTITFNGFTTSGIEDIGLFGSITGAFFWDLNLISTAPDIIDDNSPTIVFGLLAARASKVNAFGCTTTLTSNIRVPKGVFTMGGLFGVASDSFATACFANISLIAVDIPTMYFGALIGNSTTSGFDRCEAHVSYSAIACKSLVFGGLIGVSSSLFANGSIAECGVVLGSQLTSAIVGGATGLILTSTAPTVVTLVKVILRFESNAPANVSVGGVAGTTNFIVQIKHCDASFFLNSRPSEALIGGLVGSSAGLALVIIACKTNTTMLIPSMEASTPLIYAAGILGLAAASTNLINISVAFFSLVAYETDLIVGGLVGSATVIQLVNSSSIGSVTIHGTSSTSVLGGGLVGNATSSGISQCFYIGATIIAQSKSAVFGALVGLLTNTPIQKSYAIANISINAGNVSTGLAGIAVTSATAAWRGIIIPSVIIFSYATLHLDVTASTALAVGAMVGRMMNGTIASSSFALADISCAGSVTTGSVGGFIGTVEASSSDMSVSSCYVWGHISFAISSGSKATLGGFAGSFLGPISVTNCVVYTGLVSTASDATVGLFVGLVSLQNVADTSKSGKIQNVVAYVAPTGKLGNIGLVGVNVASTISDAYCAKLPSTTGCTPLSSLNSKTFLEAFDFKTTFQLNESLANGSLTLMALPAPLNGTAIRAPLLVLPSSSIGPTWSSSEWTHNESLQDGFPFLNNMMNNNFCSPSLGCHGFSVSPVDVVCNSGWSFPPQSLSTLSSTLARCSVFACTSDDDCSLHGSCELGSCQCAEGFTGLDCSAQICPTQYGAPCGFNRCRRFSPTSATGLCTCEKTDVVTNKGICITACNTVGAGLCLGANLFTCLEGYTPISGCVVYDCSLQKDNACNGKGTCTDKKCTCNSGTVLVSGNCYTPCSSTVTENCIHVTCGNNRACLGLGLCTSSLSGKSASCVCNVDASGAVAATHLGGALCQDCAVGYRKHGDNCVKNTCSMCLGGECAFDEVSGTFHCTCKEGQTLLFGVCTNSHCGSCTTGLCRSIPNGLSLLDHYCLCSTGLPDEFCYGYNCSACQGGYCYPDTKTMLIQCACPTDHVLDALSGNCEAVDKERNNVLLIVPIVVAAVVVLVTVITIVTVVTMRRHKTGVTIFVTNHPSLLRFY